MKCLASCLLGTIGGYVAGAVGGFALVGRASGNTHDKAVEAAMTGTFVFGPLGAIIGGIAGFLSSRRQG